MEVYYHYTSAMSPLVSYNESKLLENNLEDS